MLVKSGDVHALLINSCFFAYMIINQATACFLCFENTNVFFIQMQSNFINSVKAGESDYLFAAPLFNVGYWKKNVVLVSERMQLITALLTWKLFNELELYN